MFYNTMYRLMRSTVHFLRLCAPSNTTKASLCVHHKNLSALITSRALCASISNTSAVKSEEDVRKLAQGDEQVEHKLKVLMLEIEVLRQEGQLVPESDTMKDEYWLELLKLNSRSARKKYLTFLFKRIKTKENKKKRQEEKRLEYEANKPDVAVKPNENEIVYGLMGNNIFLRFYDSTMNHFYNYRLMQAMQFGQKIVVDCSYDLNMNKRENVNCAKQLMMLFGENRVHADPYDVHFCNTNFDGDLMKYLGKHIPTMHDPDFPMNLHQESYLDLFPRENLVYLTPHTREEMLEYDHDSVYIIGAIVDKMNSEPLSLAKAKKEGIRMAKFPLDRHLEWGSGSGKSLTLNQCLAILNDVKVTGDWKYALRHVPKRKLTDFNTGMRVEESTELRYDKTITSYRRKMYPKMDIKSSLDKSRGFGGRFDVKNVFD